MDAVIKYSTFGDEFKWWKWCYVFVVFYFLLNVCFSFYFLFFFFREITKKCRKQPRLDFYFIALFVFFTFLFFTRDHFLRNIFFNFKVLSSRSLFRSFKHFVINFYFIFCLFVFFSVFFSSLLLTLWDSLFIQKKLFHNFHEISSQLDRFMCMSLMIRRYKNHLKKYKILLSIHFLVIVRVFLINLNQN